MRVGAAAHDRVVPGGVASHAVGVGAAGDAASAEDALGSVAHQARSQLVDMSLGVCALVLAFSGVRDVRHVKQFALAVLVALLAVHVVVREQQLDAGSSRLHCLRGGDADLHSLGYRINAGCHQASRTGRFHKTYAAGAVVALAVVKGAERRDLIAAGLRRFQNGLPFLNAVGNAFNFYIYFCHE